MRTRYQKVEFSVGCEKNLAVNITRKWFSSVKEAEMFPSAVKTHDPFFNGDAFDLNNLELLKID
jgi:hypothetical protein